MLNSRKCLEDLKKKLTEVTQMRQNEAAQMS